MSAFSAAILARAGLVAYWQFGDATSVLADDSGPNGRDGIGVGVITAGVQGPVLNDTVTAMGGFAGGAGGGYFNVTHNAVFNIGDGPFTLLAMFKRGDALPGGRALIGKATGLRFGLVASALTLRRGASNIFSSTVTVTDTTKWHLGIVTKHATAGKVYMDGIDRTPASYTDLVIADNAIDITIGAETAAASTKWIGALGHVAIFNQVLSPTEVANLWLLARGLGIGIATESDSAIVLGRQKSKAIGIASESDVPLTPDKEKVQSITRGEEVDTAQPLVAEKRKAIGLASEIDTAEPLESVKQRAIGPATETDAAEPLDAQKRKGIGYAEETDEARALARAKSQAIGPATELDEGQALGRTKVQAISLALEQDEAMPLAMPGQIIVPIGIASEVDEAMPLGQVIVPPTPTPTPSRPRGTTGVSPMLPERRILVPKIVAIGIAEEHDEALALSFEKRPSRNQIDEEELYAIGAL